MAEYASGASAVVELVAKLVEIGVTEWRRREDARKHLFGIVREIREELVQNWSALKEGLLSETAVTLASGRWRAAAAALQAALADEPLVRRPLEQAYRRASNPVSPQPRKTMLWAFGDVQLAIAAVDEFVKRERLVHWRPTDAECQPPPRIEALLAGLPLVLITEVAEIWRRFLDAVAANRVQRYSVEEVEAVRGQRNPLFEAKTRSDARARFGDNHCFELAKGVWEFWIDAESRILFTTVAGEVRPLVLVRLSGPEEEGWSTEYEVELAACRRARLNG